MYDNITLLVLFTLSFSLALVFTLTGTTIEQNCYAYYEQNTKIAKQLWKNNV